MHKLRKCKVCAVEFRPFNSMQKVCDPRCALAFARIKSRKDEAKKVAQEKKRHNEMKRRLNETVPNLTKKAQAEFNKYIRLRDFAKPCVSCGRYDHEIKHGSRGGKWDCGHYRSVGSAPELRFETLNAHKQCKKCNQFLSGNHVEYRFGIARRLTDDELKWLEGPHEPKRYRVDELKMIIKKFRQLIRELEVESVD